MNRTTILTAATLTAAFTLSACQSDNPQTTQTDTCGAAQHQSLVGSPSSAAVDLDLPGESRHFGRNELVTTDFRPTRLNIEHSGTALGAVTDPTSTVIRIFCG